MLLIKLQVGWKALRKHWLIKLKLFVFAQSSIFLKKPCTKTPQILNNMSQFKKEYNPGLQAPLWQNFLCKCVARLHSIQTCSRPALTRWCCSVPQVMLPGTRCEVSVGLPHSVREGRRYHTACLYSKWEKNKGRYFRVLNTAHGRATGRLLYIPVNWQFLFFYGRYFSFLSPRQGRTIFLSTSHSASHKNVSLDLFQWCQNLIYGT